jgi:hypothetical protein
MELDILGVQIIMKPGTVPNKLSLTPLSLNYSSPIKDIIVTDLTQFRYSGYLLIARLLLRALMVTLIGSICCHHICLPTAQ